MRQERITQTCIFDLFAGHEIGRELKAMSDWLDEHRAVLCLVAGDLRRHQVKETGRQGLPAEAVLRCALLKQHRQLSYEELAFHLEDSVVPGPLPGFRYRGLPKSRYCTRRRRDPGRDLGGDQSDVAFLRQQQKLEDGGIVRLDSTVTAALLHEPSDSSLLWDAVRVMVRLLREADSCLAASDSVARSPPRGEETGPRHPVYAWSAQTRSALSRTDQNHPRNLSPSLAEAQLATAAAQLDHFGSPNSVIISR